jgi:hypothetical protein
MHSVIHCSVCCRHMLHHEALVLHWHVLRSTLGGGQWPPMFVHVTGSPCIVGICLRRYIVSMFPSW